ncbi:hypothetical protein [Pseudolactococcus insecticola]|uniref:Uncharacterized protein n=1 Tax=Pseudolactococcus insecticola TaxID=2709158 RepID=A0A6A0B7P1_9LACT|nr:hypothetical protein [Lactococcus insecticola]GFH41439.1 hypothetical protein Hs20B_18370 [Lactococcus insecticola]
MYRYFMLMIPSDKLKAYPFLSKTAVLKKDNFFMFVYFEPFDLVLKDMITNNIIVKIAREFDLKHLTATKWTVARDYPPALPDDVTRRFISRLDTKATQASRTGGHYLQLDRGMIDILTNGLYTRRDVTAFVKALYIAGYGYFDTLRLFTNITRVYSEDFAQHFIKYADELYRNGDLKN